MPRYKLVVQASLGQMKDQVNYPELLLLGCLRNQKVFW